MSLPWIHKTTKKQSKPRRNKKGSVIFPIFEDASLYVEDRYWMTLLVSMSKGIYPRNIKYSNGTITCIKPKQAQLTISDDPEEVATEFIDFMREYAKMKSDQEIRDDLAARYSVKTWSDIKTRGAKKKYIMQFVSNKIETMKNENIIDGLEPFIELKALLSKSFYFEILKDSDVVFEAGIIVDIEGLYCVHDVNPDDIPDNAFAVNNNNFIFFVVGRDIVMGTTDTTKAMSNEEILYLPLEKIVSFRKSWEKFASYVFPVNKKTKKDDSESISIYDDSCVEEDDDGYHIIM